MGTDMQHPQLQEPWISIVLDHSSHLIIRKTQFATEAMDHLVRGFTYFLDGDFPVHYTY